jgi:hypothetical protein
VDAPVSASLLHNLDRAQDLLASWNPRNPWARLRRVRLSASEVTEREPGAAATGLFFTCGVDSLHSLLHVEEEHGHAADLLLYVEGFDVPLSSTTSAAFLRTHLARAAEAAGRPFAIARTNLRDLIDPVVSWEMTHGAALAAVGHVLARHARRWVISSADAYMSGAVYGTAEALDPAWARHGLDFLTGGAGLDRLSKLSRLVGEPLARRHLVVCWQARARVANCGRCAKCVRTALQLLVLGALEDFDTLPHRIEPSALDRIVAEPVHRVFIWEDLLCRLRQQREWGDLAAAVERLIARSRCVQRGPRPLDVLTTEGRRLSAEWLRRQVQPRLPVAARRRLLPLVRRLRA